MSGRGEGALDCRKGLFSSNRLAVTRTPRPIGDQRWETNDSNSSAATGKYRGARSCSSLIVIALSTKLRILATWLLVKACWENPKTKSGFGLGKRRVWMGLYWSSPLLSPFPAHSFPLHLLLLFSPSPSSLPFSFVLSFSCDSFSPSAPSRNINLRRLSSVRYGGFYFPSRIIFIDTPEPYVCM
jgi:hypothetical protein